MFGKPEKIATAEIAETGVDRCLCDLEDEEQDGGADEIRGERHDDRIELAVDDDQRVEEAPDPADCNRNDDGERRADAGLDEP